MKRICLCLLCVLCTCIAIAQQPFAIVVHGGAGYFGNQPEAVQAAYKAAMQRAIDAGYDVLSKGGNATDAVERAVMVLEDDSLFNAGKGAVFTHAGSNELDAAIMDGSNMKAGAVAGVTTIKNPITAARAVMDKSMHIMMTGKGAELFARENGCTVVKPAYFYTKHSWDALQNALRKEQKQKEANKKKAMLQPDNYDEKYGTVGAVALDKNGHLAAATSTGGMTNKRHGRVGDAPVIGAGTYANNICAISCTGWGEYFIRLVMAKSVSDRMGTKRLYA
jgi:L-asparaginase / beta-aspartyl-peptidase